MDSVFDRLYKEYQQDVFQFLIYMVKNKDTAEDLLQEVFIKVMNSYHRFEGKSSEKTWLFSIAKNVTIDYFRKQKTIRKRVMDHFDWGEREISGQEPLPEEIAEQSEQVKKLYTCLDYCTTDQKMVIITRYIQDLNISETAEVLGWSEGKVKTTQHRAIKKLKELMSDEEEEVQ
ncbi:RNA polymerase sigma factor SigX [Jeotgalibacillus malaysiensis]|uniref:RNA polymerase sigma factor n=1 Tax=Jeotgalibacillus malaysiensis TaxID=1508404 RepID=A0A0B5ARU1_9BACL|nr:RNA polymerase sigma factor SigX [Jeotgalibacillus malaysiensis]AJD91337.1 RNA polymerase sigma factor SigX [Jeotgalibacillus malaysiensis]